MLCSPKGQQVIAWGTVNNCFLITQDKQFNMNRWMKFIFYFFKKQQILKVDSTRTLFVRLKILTNRIAVLLICSSCRVESF